MSDDAENIYIENIALSDNFDNTSVKILEADLAQYFRDQPGNVHSKDNIVVVKGDSLKMALRAALADLDTVVLNFANNDAPGGGFRMKGNTQEEILMKRTTLGATLPPYMYPLDQREDRFRYYHYRKLGIAYSPEIWILRDKNYEMMPKPARVSMITCAAVNNPRSASGEYSYDSDRDITRRKIRMILATAVKYRKQVLVAGMWGVGAFGNPLEICRIWREEIARYPDLRVVFPIMGESAGEFVRALMK